MAHITTEQVADIRARLKAEFPASDGWKFSVRRDRTGLSVSVDVMAGPHEFKAYTDSRDAGEGVKTVTYGTVNHYWIKEHWTPDSAEILLKICNIISRDHWDESDAMTDYFHCAYYMHMGIGQWHKPYAMAGQGVQIAAA